MSGSLGGGKSKSYQEQQATGFQQSEQSSISQSQSDSLSTSQQGSQSQSQQDIAFRDLYAGLYGNATGAAGRAVAGADELGSAAKQLFTGGSQFLQGLGGDAGSNYLESRLDSNNPVLEQQISQLQQDTGRLFREELNPAITSRAVSGGTLGGGRQGVAQGLAAEGAANVFAKGATALRAGDVASRDAIAQSVATNSLNAASTGLGALPSLLDVLQRGNNAELGVYGDLSSILGGPTTLTQSGSTSSGTSEAVSSSSSLAESLAKAYGEQQSSGYGRSNAWNFDTSFSMISHSSTKENIKPAGDLLNKLEQLQINTWNYKNDPVRHIGPMAEQFHKLFDVGDGMTINVIDVMGVLLGAMRELARESRETAVEVRHG
jgi:hypothetical protein